MCIVHLLAEPRVPFRAPRRTGAPISIRADTVRALVRESCVRRRSDERHVSLIVIVGSHVAVLRFAALDYATMRLSGWVACRWRAELSKRAGLSIFGKPGVRRKGRASAARGGLGCRCGCITRPDVHHRGESLYQYPKLDALPAAQRMQDCWASYIICRSLLLLLRRYITAWLSISHRRSAASKPIHTGYSKSKLSRLLGSTLRHVLYTYRTILDAGYAHSINACR